MSRKKHEEEHENHERWAVSYADMMTVLCALFIVLYAMSAVDQDKYEQLRQSLAVGFGNSGASIIEGTAGKAYQMDNFEVSPDFSGVAHDAQEGINSGGISQEALDYLAAAIEFETLAGVQGEIEERLDLRGLSANVTFQIDDRGLIVGLVGSNVFFKADDAALTPVAEKVVDALAEALREGGRELSVEGHANVLPSSRYATNWELSGDRATQVLRRFVEYGKIPANSIASVGFGDSRPVNAGTTQAALAENRRVDIVVRSAVPEKIRALLPDIAAAIDAGTLTHETLREQITAGTPDIDDQGETL